MARQSTTPVSFSRSIRKDTSVLMTSGRAGVVVPVGYIPLLQGDSCSGRVGIDVQLKEMPKPLLNAVHANFQAWFVPKSAFPQFAGRDELIHAFTGHKISALGQPDRNPPPYFSMVNRSQSLEILEKSPFIRTLGLHRPGDTDFNTDLLDAFGVIYNFRLAAHSSKLKRRKYAQEDLMEASDLPRAFWPSSRFARVVPDYERALLVGALDLDVSAGRVPVDFTVTGRTVKQTNGKAAAQGPLASSGGLLRNLNADGELLQHLQMEMSGSGVGQLAGQSIAITLADIDKARTTQAFAKLRTAYAGNDTTGFNNDDAIVAMLMQGIPVPDEQFSRPWLLDSRRVPVGFAERFATDAANLDQSVTRGRASAQLSLNVPVQDTGGVIIFTCEVLPERIDERMSDEWTVANSPDDLPNALRDVQRVEPVDLVLNRRIDARHSRASALYGYEPMNDKWNRDFTRLGGLFYQERPGSGWSENRANIWQTEIVNPSFGDTHYLAPANFPHSVFSDPNADAFEIVCRHSVAINGLTQIGDVLAEDNNDYAAVLDAGN